MFDHLYTLADGQCVYQGSTKQLVPFLGGLGLQCPSYHNPASFIIEVACGEYGDNIGKLVTAIKNGKEDIRDGRPFPDVKCVVPKLNNAKFADETSNDASNILNKNENVQTEKFVEKNSSADSYNVLNNAINNIAKDEMQRENASGLPTAPPSESETPNNVTAALLENSVNIKQPRYGNSQLKQFFIILNRTLLFSRRDWVSNAFLSSSV